MKVCMAVMVFVLCVVAALPNGNPARGKDAFAKRCSGCHGLDSIKEGPMLRNIFGRRAGAATGFPYSDGMKNAHLTWDEATLNRWLEDPEKLIPGNDMSTHVPDAADRANIIAYLKTQAKH